MVRASAATTLHRRRHKQGYARELQMATLSPTTTTKRCSSTNHPDHLGSSSYITNLDGEVSQHIEYVPFGEVFIEERNDTWNTPYLFNAKEFDEETGMYYYGARYYEPRLSLWMSVDPRSEEAPEASSYTYSHNAPTGRVDFDGKWDIKVSASSDRANHPICYICC